jgi:hypothetical protein
MDNWLRHNPSSRQTWDYRFNKTKNDPEKPRKRQENQEGGGDMM